ELDEAVGTVNAKSHGFLRREDLGSKAASLRECAPCQVGAGEAGRKSEVVLDARTHARLAAGSRALDQQSLRAFGGSVTSGDDAGAPAAHDDEVVEGGFSASAQTHARGQFVDGGIEQHFASRQDHKGKRNCFQVYIRNQLLDLLVGTSDLDIGPLVRNLVATQEFLHLVTGGRPAGAQYAQ